MRIAGKHWQAYAFWAVPRCLACRARIGLRNRLATFMGGMHALVHTHHSVERVEPERTRQPAQQLVTAILENDHRAEPCHAVAQPFGHASAMQRQVGAARTLSYQRALVAATRGAISA